MRMDRTHRQHPSYERDAHEHPAKHNGVTDPECGMDVDPTAGGPRADRDGHTYHFCSDHCRAKFVADSATSLHPDTGGSTAESAASAAGSAGGSQAEYTCPMHPEVRRLGPG